MEAQRLLHRARRCGASPPAPGARLPGAPPPSPPPQWRCLLQMSDSPAGSNPRTPESSGSGSGGGGKRPAVPAAVSLLPPADPLRQANRLPIRVLKMLSAHTGHLLHPEYLQPLSSTPVSPIEVSLLVAARPAPAPFRPPLPGPRPHSLRPGLGATPRSGRAGGRGEAEPREQGSETTGFSSGFSVEGSPSTLAFRNYVFSLGLGLLLGVSTGSFTFPLTPSSQTRDDLSWAFPAPAPQHTHGCGLFEVGSPPSHSTSVPSG